MCDKKNLIGTGSTPFFLNINSSAQNFSSQELTNPSDGFLSLINKNIVVENLKIKEECEKPE